MLLQEHTENHADGPPNGGCKRLPQSPPLKGTPPFDEFDFLVGAASRSRKSAGVRAENRAVGVLLQVLTTPSDEGVLYGTLLSLRSDRLSRTREGEAARTSVLKEWDIRRIDETGVNDPVGNPGFDVIEMMGGYQSELEVSHIVAKTTAERQSAFEMGVSKFARRAVHPAVQVDPVSGVMSWDLEIVAVLREAADLLVAGAPWTAVGEAVGARIPSHVLADEDDRARARRNEKRRVLGRPEVALQFVNGRPNPLYRYESVADAMYPHLGLRAVLHRQVESPAKRDAIARYLDEDLEGIDDREMRRLFLVEGVYIRRVLDLFKSNKSVKRYRLIRFDLGAVDERGGVLSAQQFDAVWPPIDAPKYARNGRTGYAYFKGLFEVVATERMYSYSGWLSSSAGEWRFRVRADPEGGKRPSYGVQFEPSSKLLSFVTVGLVSQPVLHESVRDSILKLLDAPETLGVDTAWVVRARDRAGDLSGLERRLEVAKESLKKAVAKTLQTGMTAEREEALEAIVRESEVAVRELGEELERRRSKAEHPAVVSGLWPVGTTVDLLAVLGMVRKFDKFATRAIQAAAQDVIRDGKIWIRLDGMVEWSATFTLVNEAGEVIEHPIGGVVVNQSRDVWVRREWPVLWWEAATGVGVPDFPAGVAHLDRRGRSSKWAGRVAERIARVAGEAGVKLRPNVAKAIVWCPDWDVVRLALRIVAGESVRGEVADLLRRWLFVDDAGAHSPFDVTPQSFHRVWARVLPELRG